MLLELTRENAKKVLTLFSRGEIAELHVNPVTIDGRKSFACNYTTVNSLNAHHLAVASRTLNHENSYMARMRVMNILEKFIENVESGTIVRFTIKFSVIGRPTALLNTCVQFSNETSAEHVSSNEVSEKFTATSKTPAECLQKLKALVNEAGVAHAKVGGIFKREGNGRGKKNTPVTISEVINILETMLTENKT